MADDGSTPDAREDTHSVSLGEFIASQRRSAELSLRQLAERAGISNPYISQIERGLRKPSAEVLQSLAGALSVSASTLYTYAGIPEPDDEASGGVAQAIERDPKLTQEQKTALVGVYDAFLASTSSTPNETE